MHIFRPVPLHFSKSGVKSRLLQCSKEGRTKMTTFPMRGPTGNRLDKFNGPILDREQLQHGTYVAMLTLVGSVILVGLVKAAYLVF